MTYVISFLGEIEEMKCTQIMKHSNVQSTRNDFLCVPIGSPYVFSWRENLDLYKGDTHTEGGKQLKGDKRLEGDKRHCLHWETAVDVRSRIYGWLCAEMLFGYFH